MDYNITKDNIRIYNSWIYSKHGFRSRLEGLKREYESECLVLQNRSIWSMEMEWAIHNFLYMLSVWQDHTQDVDLNWPQKWYMKLLYAVTGPISWLFIR